MPTTFLIADTHFGHANICKFVGNDGVSPVRPWDNPDEMDEALVDNWNKVVRENDKVYHLGDVVINRRCLKIMERLKGKKRLVRGNHDLFRTKDYLKYFDEIRGVTVLSDMILSHIPLHPECITPRFGTNVHGHLHSNSLDDPRYFNVSVERINYTPISLEELRQKISEAV